MNIELFSEVLDYIKANPAQWKQSVWGSVDRATSEFCGCFAGHLLLKGQGGAIDKGAIDMVADTAKALSISYDEAYFLTQKCRTIADFEFFLENGSIINPANGRFEDADGYGVTGYDARGFDRYGFDRDGYDAKGYDVEGYDINGYDTLGYDSFGYDACGDDADGFDEDGFDRDGFDRDGFDQDGFDRKDYNRDGFDRDGFARDDTDRDGWL